VKIGEVYVNCDAPVANRGCSRRLSLLKAIALTLLAATVACRDKDVTTASYATMAEAREAGAANRDLPLGIPEGAHDIRVASDPDSNRKWGLFNFHREDVDTLRAMLQQDEQSLAGVECDIPTRIEWWPLLLRGSINADQAKAAGLQSYRSKQGNLIVVVNWKQGRAYFWNSEF
jgi:hypothetical protein